MKDERLDSLRNFPKSRSRNRINSTCRVLTCSRIGLHFAVRLVDASGARDVGLGGELRVHIGGCATSVKSVETQTAAWVNPGSRGA